MNIIKISITYNNRGNSYNGCYSGFIETRLLSMALPGFKIAAFLV